MGKYLNLHSKMRQYGHKTRPHMSLIWKTARGRRSAKLLGYKK